MTNKYPTGSAVARALKRDAGITTVPRNRQGYHVRTRSANFPPSISVDLTDLLSSRRDRETAAELARSLTDQGWEIQLEPGSTILYVHKIAAAPKPETVRAARARTGAVETLASAAEVLRMYGLSEMGINLDAVAADIHNGTLKLTQERKTHENLD